MIVDVLERRRGPDEHAPSPRRPAVRGLVGAVVLLVFVSCRPTATSSWPPARPVVNVTMREYSFDYGTGVPPGQVVFHVVNAGTTNHRLIVAPVPDDYPPVAEQIQGGERRPIDPIAGIPNRPPGDQTTFAVNLTRGRYYMVCFVRDPDGRTHAQKGMATEFRVTSESGAGE